MSPPHSVRKRTFPLPREPPGFYPPPRLPDVMPSLTFVLFFYLCYSSYHLHMYPQDKYYSILPVYYYNVCIYSPVTCFLHSVVWKFFHTGSQSSSSFMCTSLHCRLHCVAMMRGRSSFCCCFSRFYTVLTTSEIHIWKNPSIIFCNSSFLGSNFTLCFNVDLNSVISGFLSLTSSSKR